MSRFDFMEINSITVAYTLLKMIWKRGQSRDSMKWKNGASNLLIFVIFSQNFKRQSLELNYCDFHHRNYRLYGSSLKKRHMCLAKSIVCTIEMCPLEVKISFVAKMRAWVCCSEAQVHLENLQSILIFCPDRVKKESHTGVCLVVKCVGV